MPGPPPPGPGGPPPGGAPGETDKPRDAIGALRRLVGYLRPILALLALAVCTSIAATTFDVLAPKQLGIATTTVFEGAAAVGGTGIDFDKLRRVLATVLALYSMSAICNYLTAVTMARVTQSVVYRLRQDAEEKLNRIPVSYFDSHSKGDILSRVVNDIDLISSTLQDTLTQAISAVITLVGVVVMMLSISPLMTLIALVTLPISAWVTSFVAKRSQKYYLAQQTALGTLDAHIEETYGGHTEVRAFAHEDRAVADFERINREYYSCAWRAQFVSGIIRPITGFVGNAAYVAVCVVGGMQVVSGAIAVGDIQAFAQYTRNFTRPISQIASIVNTFQATLAGAERVFELLDAPEMDGELPSGESPALDEAPGAEGEPPADESAASASTGEVEFRHVRFGYDPERPVIRDFSAHVSPGRTVAIVGPTGAGKTTLVNLLMRFYDVDAGAILLDGTDTREMTRHELRGHIAMVLQDTWLFSGSIRDNIAYGAPGATDADVEAAARAAQADSFVRSLPDGYGTVVNEEATNISAGQRQLLTIARALLADPDILVLDEATSSIDTRTEAALQRAFATLMEGRTCFVIAHRLSTVRGADEILVVRDGDIVEQGTHESLLAADGFYASLYNSQFDGCE